MGLVTKSGTWSLSELFVKIHFKIHSKNPVCSLKKQPVNPVFLLINTVCCLTDYETPAHTVGKHAGF